ncbi:MAG: gliding motility-associated ABC transporter substrate-binding protein GldG [Bacteroidales bacterium]|jgi:ABC-2 type transport system permease protein|nr:gliding motility-associated ABC transporter substrate-binding protein GldG [Bacteroidales bacterium]
MKTKQQNTRKLLKKHNITQTILLLTIIVVINIISIFAFYRFDLTKEKRFTISDVSKKIISNADDKILIELYFEDNNLPVELLRYQHIVKEFLKNFSSFSNKIELAFKHPYDKNDPNFTNSVYEQLYKKGLDPISINEETSTESSEKIIFAGALVKYQEDEYPVNLIHQNLNKGTNSGYLSEAELEKEFVHAIWMLLRTQIQKIAFLEDHGELNENQTHDIMTSLSKYYQIDRLKMNNQLSALDNYAVVVIAKPSKYFSERDKFIIDQYLMRGGKIIWLVEWTQISMDSLQSKVSQITNINAINIEDQLFNYGVRINPDLIQDLQCLYIPVFVNTLDGQPQFEPKPWYYFPLILPDSLETNQLVKNIDPIRTNFVSSIDTVGNNPNVKKTILLSTSNFSKTIMHPIDVSLNILRQKPDYKTFSKNNIPIAVLLEGKFASNYQNRLTLDFVENNEFNVLDESDPKAKIIVISDGDLIRNEYKSMGEKIQHYPLGYDKYYSQQFTPGNTQFMVNCINYLCANESFISLRMREIKIRLLNQTKVTQDRTFWTITNTTVPILVILLFGIALNLFRKLKYKK